jgi:hypothetical protein
MMVRAFPAREKTMLKRLVTAKMIIESHFSWSSPRRQTQTKGQTDKGTDRQRDRQRKRQTDRGRNRQRKR